MGHHAIRRVFGPANTHIAGIGRVVEGLFTFGLAVIVVALAMSVLSSLAGGSVIELRDFIPRSVISPTRGSELQVWGTAEQQAAVQQAFDDLDQPVDPSEFQVVVTDPRNLPPNAEGSYLFPDNIICLNSELVNDGGRQRLDQTLAHEVGHLFDCLYLDDGARAEYLCLRGFPAGTDWRSEDCDWTERPSEDFAEVYAAFAAASSGVQIATDRGRTKDQKRIEALIARCRPGAAARGAARAYAASLSAR